jgi:hypothetical protein
MADMVCHMESCEYKTGMTAYPGDGSTVRIDEVGHGKKDEELDCSFTWLTGKNKGGTGYIGDVRYLYIQKPYDTGDIDIL